jgi:mannosyl-3-phosphoglycerate phosphatase
MSKPKPIIFTDLDGTLLTHDTYSFEPAREAIESLRLHEIPLIFLFGQDPHGAGSIQGSIGYSGPICGRKWWSGLY